MSFLNAAFLLGLPLAAVPLVIHLLRRRNLNVVRWGAMQFLLDEAGEGRRFDQLEEKLLLALRVLALIAFVLALARPEVDWLFGGEGPERELFVVVDNSLSTSLEEQGREGFERIRDKAKELVANAPAGQPVKVLLAASGPRWLGGDSPGPLSRRGLLEELDGASFTEGGADFPMALAMAAFARSEGKPADRHVVVLTDSQAEGWQAQQAAAWDPLRSALERQDRRLLIDVISAAEAAPPAANLSLQRIEVGRTRVASGETLSLSAEVFNRGQQPSQATEIEWLVDGKVKESSAVPPLNPGKLRGVSWSVALDKIGAHEVSARLVVEDALPADNVSGVVIQVVEAAPVLVLSDAWSGGTEFAFLNAALGVREETAQSTAPFGDSKRWTSLFKPNWVSVDNIDSTTLTDYQAVILLAPQETTPEVAERLEAYVRAGGGLWAMLGARIDPPAFNAAWHRDGEGVFPQAIGKLLRPKPNSPAATIHPPAGDQPATAPLADTQRLDIDRVRLRRYHALRHSEDGVSTALLESGAGETLASLHRLGDGRAILQTFPLHPDWSTLPTSKAFVVMVQEWLAFLSEGSATRLNLQPLETLHYRLSSLTLGLDATVTNPLGEQAEATLTDFRGTPTLRYGQTTIPGRYTLEYDGGAGRQTIPFRVERPPGESDLTALDRTAKNRLEETEELRFVESPRVDAFPASTSSRRPTWWPLLLAMVCLMAGESLLACRLSRHRFGPAAPAAA